MSELQLWNTSSRIRTSAIETITNDAPRTRSDAKPSGTVRAATSAAEANSATKLDRPALVISSPVPYAPSPK